PIASGDLPEFFACRYVPQVNCAVVSARSQGLAVRTEDYRSGQTLARKLAEFFPGGQVPQADRVIGAAGGQDLASGRKGEGEDRAFVATKLVRFPSLGHVPHID